MARRIHIRQIPHEISLDEVPPQADVREHLVDPFLFGPKTGAGNVMLASSNATFMRLSNIDSSTVMKPRDIHIGARVTF